MKTVFLIAGESSSGKDLLSNMLVNDGYKLVKSYTTRPRRTGEHYTHIFIDSNEVEQYRDDIIAYTKIGEYEYFATKQQLLESDIYIIDPRGIKYMKSKYNDVRFVVIYLNVSEEERRFRAENIRKDNIEEIEKRFKAEREQFDDFKLHAAFEYSVCNYDVNKAYKILKNIIEIEKN